MNKDILYKLTDVDFVENETNKVTLVGEMLGIEEEGKYNGKNYVVVLFRTFRAKNKPLFTWVGIENNDENIKFIKENVNKELYIEGYLNVTHTFNNKAVSHTFIVPTELTLLKKEVIDSLEDLDVEDFYMSYTLNNRVVLEGRVCDNIWREHIGTVNNNVTRFQLEINVKGKSRKVYCTMWDTVNDIEDFKPGMKVKVVGSYTMLKKERGLIYKDGLIIESRKNKLDSYVVIVQKIDLLND